MAHGRCKSLLVVIVWSGVCTTSRIERRRLREHSSCHYICTTDRTKKVKEDEVFRIDFQVLFGDETLMFYTRIACTSIEIPGVPPPRPGSNKFAVEHSVKAQHQTSHVGGVVESMTVQVTDTYMQ